MFQEARTPVNSQPQPPVTPTQGGLRDSQMSSSGPISATNKDQQKKPNKVNDFYSRIIHNKKNRETGASAKQPAAAAPEEGKN